MDWRPIAECAIEEPEPVLVYNGVRAWMTQPLPGLQKGAYPVTHFARVVLPYPPIARDETRISDRDNYEAVRRHPDKVDA